jgi:hybrid polyketide synthase/nonribosomal peptide synthetase ACE1
MAYLRNTLTSELPEMEFIISRVGVDGDHSAEVKIHPLATKQQINAKLPSTLDVFIDFSAPVHGKADSAAILAALPPSCRIIHSHDLVSITSSHPTKQVEFGLGLSMKDLTTHIKKLAPKIYEEYVPASRSILSVVGSDGGSTQKDQIQAPDPQTLSSANKTYLLIGMTGEMGRSLCRWMVGNGARYVVMASRNPPLENTWCEDLTRQGARIVIRKLDVCDKSALDCMLQELQGLVPRIGGLVHAAMVLADATFAKITLQSWERAVRPKVAGCYNLNEAFKDDVLDFFILLSSLASVVGSIGQCNYAAANMVRRTLFKISLQELTSSQFMKPIAQQRRNRGLAASVIDLGMVVGVGYMNQAGPARIDMMERQYNHMRISESQLHNIFTQAIIAGHPGSCYPVELITGLTPASKSHEPLWYENPLFSHYRSTEKIEHESDSSPEQSNSVQQDVISAANEGAALDVILPRFSAQLAQILQVAPDRNKPDEPLIELGVDSLIAIEISSRLFTDLGYKVSVLKILGGMSACESKYQMIIKRYGLLRWEQYAKTLLFRQELRTMKMR